MDYTHEDLLRDMEMLRRLGLIEVVGVKPDGEWLWAPTQKSLSMTEEERENLILGDYLEE